MLEKMPLKPISINYAIKHGGKRECPGKYRPFEY